MDKKWGIIIVISSILSLVVAGLVFFNFTNKPKVVLNPPEELSINFDATVNSPKFSIQSVNLEDKTLSLKTVYPYISEEITSKIRCREGDIKISSKSNQTLEDISLDALFEKVHETTKEYMIFSGLCSDITCSEINRECYMYIGL